MYTILGVGMLHYNRYSPNKERSVAESYLWQHAITLYQKALTSKIRPENVDALLSTCMLMGIMTICPEKFEPTDSWVLTNRPEAMNWLALQSGLKTILTLASPYLSISIWGGKHLKRSMKQATRYLNKMRPKDEKVLIPFWQIYVELMRKVLRVRVFTMLL